MNDSRNRTPTEIDDIEDRMGSVTPLDFSTRQDDRKGRIGDPVPADEAEEQYPPERVAEAGLTTGEITDDRTTQDDLAPEQLIAEDGARSPSERGHGLPADRDLSVRSEHRIGADVDLDEAELGRYAPLDGKRWDGPADGDRDTGLSGGDATLSQDESQDVLSDRELEGDAPLDSARDKAPRR